MRIDCLFFTLTERPNLIFLLGTIRERPRRGNRSTGSMYHFTARMSLLIHRISSKLGLYETLRLDQIFEIPQEILY